MCSHVSSAGTCRDVANLRRVTAAYDTAATRHPELDVDVNRLLSSADEYMDVPAAGTVEERAASVMERASAVQAAIAAARHPELDVEVSRLLSLEKEYMDVPAARNVDELATAVIERASALQAAIAGNIIYAIGQDLLYRSSEDLCERVHRITGVLHDLGLRWSDMPAYCWFGP